MSHSDKCSIPGQTFVVSIIHTGIRIGETIQTSNMTLLIKTHLGILPAYKRLSDVKLKRLV
jgi:hypothetical protein